MHIFGVGDPFLSQAPKKACALVVQSRRTLEWSYVDAQLSWHAHYFGHGGGLWRALVFAAGAVSRDFWTCGSFSKIGSLRSQAKAAFWHLDVFFGSVLAANLLGRATRCEF